MLDRSRRARDGDVPHFFGFGPLIIAGIPRLSIDCYLLRVRARLASPGVGVCD